MSGTGGGDAGSDGSGDASGDDRPLVAVFRPDDERLTEAVETLDALGVEALADPMLEVRPTGAVPEGADWVVFTSKTGVELAEGAGWSPGDAVDDDDSDASDASDGSEGEPLGRGVGPAIACIGPSTADAAREAGWAIELIPEEYSSTGLVAAFDALGVGGVRIEVARSDHGSQVLLDGLRDAGATVRETVLYELVRPEGSGESAEVAAAGDLDGACFTSSLTVEHFLDAADERGVREEAIAGLEEAVVGCIGHPTRETAEDRGVTVDVVPAEATFEALAESVVSDLDG
ncbi:uroporphyrinogen-III synthase [Halobaculum gomorrense]|uniref:Uroporphyrinogen-III synthase n=1 Tax=Halobaculum gomorrense TaxID=43928 RepID=A0A1M5QDP0_9EURY|nr:uroporphyrinogen-III synthase [Halobaculum gomorrense]SHH12304.1 uroporphyrinogen-III synthase [Halobaculum gomorrense]